MLSFIADLKRKISDLSKDDKEKQEEKEADNHSSNYKFISHNHMGEN